MDKVQQVMLGMFGLNKEDALQLVPVQPLTQKLMKQHKNKNSQITDKIVVVLDKACDENKIPIVSVCRSKDDGDIVWLIVLDVPSNNAYGNDYNGSNRLVEV
jgi:hypothetical protein